MVDKAKAAPVGLEEADILLKNETFLKDTVANIIQEEDADQDGRISKEEFIKKHEEYEPIKDEL